MESINMRKGETKTIVFTVTDEDTGDPTPLTDATFTFKVKKSNLDEDAVLTKEDESFDKAQAADGIVELPIEEDDTKDLDGADYTAELKIVFIEGDIDKSQELLFILEEAIND